MNIATQIFDNFLFNISKYRIFYDKSEPTGSLIEVMVVESNEEMDGYPCSGLHSGGMETTEGSPLILV